MKIPEFFWIDLDLPDITWICQNMFLKFAILKFAKY